MDEREAVGRLKRRDITGLEALVRVYQHQALRAARLITRDAALAEDVVQSAFLHAYERIDQFDASRPFGPWFLRSVVNAAVRVATRQARQIPLDEREAGAAVIDQAQGPEELAERAETARDLWLALGQLAPAQRAVLVQRYYLGLSEAELSDSLACPPGTVKSRLHTARRRLRLLLRPGE
jgi:RNA polymerase sigma-70 factor, ECF subfamily